MMTMSLRMSVGARHCSTYARNVSPVIAPVEHQGCCDSIVAQSGHEGDGLPMSVRHATDQSLAAWATAAQPHHFCIGRGLVDEHQSGRIKHALLSNPAPARPSDVCPFLLRRAQAFFLHVILCRAKNRQSAVRLPAMGVMVLDATARYWSITRLSKTI